jgi:hypothetical protein
MASTPAPAWRICDLSESFSVVATQMIGPSAAAVGKLGTIEFQLAEYTYNSKLARAFAPLNPRFLHMLSKNAGMFPQTQATAEQMGKILLESVIHMTTVSPWWQVNREVKLYDIFNKRATRVGLQSLECFLSPNTADWWTARLPVGTRILVVSPFATTIMRQTKRLDAIWAARPGLWASGLHFECLEFPLSYGIQSPAAQAEMVQTYGSSVGLIDHYKRAMDGIEYDIALVGVGIHSLPLVVHAKRTGKRAIHTGGGTQIYFGVRGGRWDTMPTFCELFNEHWVRPDERERPPQLQLVEGGCYW